jgi:hypothetical protein
VIVYFGLVTNIHYQLLPHPVRKKNSKKAQESCRDNWDRDDRRVAESAVLTTLRTRRIADVQHGCRQTNRQSEFRIGNLRPVSAERPP